MARDYRTDTSDPYAILLRSSSWGVGTHKIGLGSALGTRRPARLGSALGLIRLGLALGSARRLARLRSALGARLGSARRSALGSAQLRTPLDSARPAARDSVNFGSWLRLDLGVGNHLHGCSAQLRVWFVLSLALSRGSALLDTGSASLVWIRARLRSSRFVF